MNDKMIKKLRWTWMMMIQRCYDQYHPSYRYYGEEGVSMDPSWINLQKFIDDVGLPPEATRKWSIDRIDNNGNYTADNVRWADWSTQSRNRKDTRLLEHNGDVRCITDWAKKISQETGEHFHTVSSRLYSGWSIEQARTGSGPGPKKKLVTIDGITKPMKQWAKENDISEGALNARLYLYNWPVEQAVTQPVRGYKSNIRT